MRDPPREYVFKGDYLMKRTTTLFAAVILGVVTVIGLSTSAFAWHPEGKIIKKVQNVTSSSSLSDANDDGTAVAAKPGDTLKYVIEVKNVGKAASNGYNDMAKTVMTDELPAGIELVSNPSQRKITEDLGVLKPGESKTKEYLVKVTANKTGSIKNTACFTGDSKANDNAQKGCDAAVVKVTIPSTPPTLPTTPKPPVVDIPVELPKTGAAENVFLTAAILGVLFYATSRYVISKRDLSKTAS